MTLLLMIVYSCAGMRFKKFVNEPTPQVLKRATAKEAVIPSTPLRILRFIVPPLPLTAFAILRHSIQWAGGDHN
ncbi:hypothetical protein [Brucella abortus]|uniref:hypothetical protein n=1 Tax=Brucella abortus TaxID=235 RepID=UPI0009AEC4A3|nr:hypothetical protein [Brucella abortus]